MFSRTYVSFCVDSTPRPEKSSQLKNNPSDAFNDARGFKRKDIIRVVFKDFSESENLSMCQ